MYIKSFSQCVIGATLAYAGLLTLPQDPYVGSGLVVIGTTLVAYGIWKSLLRFRNSSEGSPVSGAKGGKGRKKTHLKVVKTDKEKRRTYH